MLAWDYMREDDECKPRRIHLSLILMKRKALENLGSSHVAAKRSVGILNLLIPMCQACACVLAISGMCILRTFCNESICRSRCLH